MNGFFDQKSLWSALIIFTSSVVVPDKMLSTVVGKGSAPGKIDDFKPLTATLTPSLNGKAASVVVEIVRNIPVGAPVDQVSVNYYGYAKNTKLALYGDVVSR